MEILAEFRTAVAFSFYQHHIYMCRYQVVSKMMMNTCSTSQHRNRLSSSGRTGLKVSEIPQDSLSVQMERPV